MSWLTDKLKNVMTQRSLTVDKVARDLAVERSRLNKIIDGSVIPNENLTKRFAKYFGEDTGEWLNNAKKREDSKRAVASIPPDFFKVAKVSEVPEGDMKIVFNDLVALANANGKFYAFGNICPHAAGPLGEGFLEGCVVECPWHAAQWDVSTGKPLTGLATSDIPVFEVRLVGDDIEIKLTGAVLAQGANAGHPL
jgi:nitrite reductase/ring-hydroxylating ferredoxin subunit/plasmid maintenance system antidote protein VapI